MKQVIIFDFNRTLYNPESQRIIASAKYVLATLKKRGYPLYLISRAEKSRRETIKNNGIEKFFKGIVICRQKNKSIFQKIAKREAANTSFSFIIGDRIKEEIAIGNKMGIQTIWFKNGKFKNELPKNKTERPDFIVKKLKEILRIIP